MRSIHRRNGSAVPAAAVLSIYIAGLLAAKGTSAQLSSLGKPKRRRTRRSRVTREDTASRRRTTARNLGIDEEIAQRSYSDLLTFIEANPQIETSLSMVEQIDTSLSMVVDAVETDAYSASNTVDRCVAAGGDLDAVEGENICVLPTENILRGLLEPADGDGGRRQLPTKFADGSDVPDHLQYAIWLDQAGAIGDGMSVADPEAAVTTASSTKDRCFGGGWAFYQDDVEEFAGTKLTATGKDMFARLVGKDRCDLTFDWNRDFTKAKIYGYMEEVFDWAGIGNLLGAVAKLTIELQPFWAWKFGLARGNFSAKDGRCCPPKDGDGASCRGRGAIGTGKPGCLTISEACGKVSDEDIGDCAMWRRKNSVQIFPFPWTYALPGYDVYPIGDVGGVATGFFPKFLDTMKDNGVNGVFYGIPPAPQDQTE